ncbi:MAG: DUF3025 domain-containing protein [Gammaproteobacteria bacterium]
MRFVAPPRHAVPPAHFAHPAYRDLPCPSFLTSAAWPSCDTLNAALGAARHAFSDVPLQFVAQSCALLADGLHYETRIHDSGAIATRERNWHDLFNALVWLAQPRLKSALNAAYVQDGPGARRTRRQCALTHFDEAGAVLLLRDPSLLVHWDRHDWPALLHTQRAAWAAGARLVLAGHALLELLLDESRVPTAKCVVCRTSLPTAEALARLAHRIASGTCLRDPTELRPLPLAGLPGWDDSRPRAFYVDSPWFRPLRPGRRYPPPLCLD